LGRLPRSPRRFKESFDQGDGDAFEGASVGDDAEAIEENGPDFVAVDFLAVSAFDDGSEHVGAEEDGVGLDAVVAKEFFGLAADLGDEAWIDRYGIHVIDVR